MYKTISWVMLTVLSAFILSGCSTYTALQELTYTNKSLDVSEKSIIILSLCCDNSFRDLSTKDPWYPMITSLTIESSDKTFKDNFFIPNIGYPFSFCRDVEIMAYNSAYNISNNLWITDSVASFYLKPGRYILSNVSGISREPSYGQIIGSFKKTLRYEFSVNPNEICYVGHLYFHSRPKKNGEESEAGVFPVLNQSLSGVRDCFWEVTAKDNDVYNDIDYCKSLCPKISYHPINIRMGRLVSDISPAK